MEIESQNKEISPKNLPKIPNSIKSYADQITEKLKSAMDQKHIPDLHQITYLLKKAYPLLNLTSLQTFFTESDNFYAKYLTDALLKNDSSFPSPKNENEIVQLILLGLTYYKTKSYGNSQAILESLLFESPHDLATRVYLIPLSGYLLYKFLNAIELDNQFSQLKNKVYNWLTLFQNNTYETLFSTVYLFLLRNLLKTGQLREATQLLKNCKFPEHLGHSLLAKYLFYKAVYLANIGQISQALNFITESLRKAPDGNNKKGLNGFRLRARKLQIVLQLIVNEPPSHQLLTEYKTPQHYGTLVHAVNRGEHSQFARILVTHRQDFAKDQVLHLVDKIRSVVMKNALKKLSVAYSKISIPDVLSKIGADQDVNFELNAFLTKSRADLPEFTLDHKNGFIEFTQRNDNYFSAATRESLIKRVKHLQGLEEQVVKSLKFRVVNKEVVNEEDNGKSDEDDDHFSDYSVNDLDM